MITIIPSEKSRVSCACMIIVRDAENTIAQCFDSILKANCFDQLIIIQDDRTRDRTPEIIENIKRLQGENLIYRWYNWKDYDFSAARNEAMRYVKAKYGFWMDSDDVLIDSFGVSQLLRYPGGHSYHFKVIIPGPNWSNTSIINHLRLFPMLPGVRWELPIHEQIAFSLRERGVKEIETPYRILHLGYLKSEDVDKKHKRNFNIMVDWLSKNKENSDRRRYLLDRYNDSVTYMKLRGEKA